MSKKILSYIRSSVSKVNDLLNQITYKNNLGENTDKEEQDILTLFETATRKLYDYFSSSNLTSENYKSNITEEQESFSFDDLYSFEVVPTGYKFVIPPLINRRSLISNKNKYVNLVLERLIQNNIDYISRKEYATVIIIACHKDLSKAIDVDNEDIHSVINIINRYIMSTDDSPEYINLVLDAKKADENKTEIYVIDQIHFSFSSDSTVCFR